MKYEFQVRIHQFRIGVNDVFSPWVEFDSIAKVDTISGTFIGMTTGPLESHRVYKVYPMQTELTCSELSGVE